MTSAFENVIPDASVRRNALLRDYTTMRVGGPADYLVEPASEEALCRAVETARLHSLPLCVMGNGSNLLFSDEGFRGVVLHIGKAFSRVQCDGCRITAQSGALLATAARQAAEHALTGMEFASGIPGSIGGAVYMNAGAYGGEIGQIFENATVLIDGRLEKWQSSQMKFGYRHSAAMEKDCLILSATFLLQPGDRQHILDTMNDLNNRRREKQPLQYPSCGSFFKRPAGHFAGALIEQAGLKGYSIGDAQVSEKHAGFIVNRGHATSEQIYSLMRHVQETVFRQSGVTLEPEVKFVGNFEA